MVLIAPIGVDKFLKECCTQVAIALELSPLGTAHGSHVLPQHEVHFAVENVAVVLQRLITTL